jgi:hypothetical protein
MHSPRSSVLMSTLHIACQQTEVSRRRKDVFRLEREREKFGTELSEARGMYMQALEDVKASHMYPLLLLLRL